MTDFYSLRQALEFRPSCPLCHEKLMIDDQYAQTKTDWQDGQRKTRLSWRTEGEEIILDLDSNHIEIVRKYFELIDYKVSGAGGYHGKTFTPKIPYDGHLYERLGLTCDKCNRYSYMLQMIIDIGAKRIDGFVLNHERISVEDKTKGIVHEIKNVYTTRETEYTYFPSVLQGGTKLLGSDQKITLPLIALDLDHPEKTVERIRTLILFS